MVRNNYWKSLLGNNPNAKILLAGAVEYTAEVDIEAFVANAPEGAIGIFKASDDTVATALGGSVAASANEYYIAVKRDGLVDRSRTFVPSKVSRTKGAYAAAAAQVSIANFAGAPVAGKYYAVKIIETTPGYQPFPQWEYKYVAKTGDTLAGVLTAIAADVNNINNPVNANSDALVTAVAGATTLTFTAKVKGASFRIAFSRDLLDDLAASAAYSGAGTTRPSYGSGTVDQVKQLEAIGFVHDGVTTNYPGDGQANPEDFGKPSSVITAGAQFDIFILVGEKEEKSPTPVEKHFQGHQIILAANSNGAVNPAAELATILGL